MPTHHDVVLSDFITFFILGFGEMFSSPLVKTQLFQPSFTILEAILSFYFTSLLASEHSFSLPILQNHCRLRIKDSRKSLACLPIEVAPLAYSVG